VLGFTPEQGAAKVRAHDYRHDGGAFDLLADRYIENLAWRSMFEPHMETKAK
jgi:hypothetical protein